MPRTTRPLLALLLATGTALAADDPAEKYTRAVKAEDETARKLGERVAKPGDSERERWFKRLDEVYTNRVPANPADWFDLITAGQAEWKRDGSKYFAEFHERIGQRLELKKDVPVSREMFAAYAEKFLGSDSPPWKLVDADGEARGVFKQLDLNRDGSLIKEECSPGLQERFDTADADKDAKISPDEYRDYFRRRVGYESQNPSFAPPSPPDKPKDKAPPVAEAPDEPRPKVLTDAKQLPKEVPGWFRELDGDKDLQVSLAEWVGAKRRPADFQEMDLNADGLLEAGELLRFRKVQAAEPKDADLRAGVPDAKKGKGG